MRHSTKVEGKMSGFQADAGASRLSAVSTSMAASRPYIQASRHSIGK